MKLLLRLLVAGVLLVVLLVVLLSFVLDPMARSAVEGGVTHATGSATTLDSAKIALLDGEVAFDSLSIANPPGFSAKPLLSIGHFQASCELGSLLEDEIVVDLLELDGLDLSLELNGTASNVVPLIERLRELTAAGGGGDEAPPAGEEKPSEGGGGKDVLIKKIRIAGVHTALSITGVPGIEGSYSAEVPEFVIEGLGTGEESGTIAQWSARILEAVLVAAKDAKGNFPPQYQALLSGDLDALKAGVLKDLGQKGKDLLEEQLGDQVLPDEAKKAIDEVLEDPKKAADEVLKNPKKKLKGLLGGDE